MTDYIPPEPYDELDLLHRDAALAARREAAPVDIDRLLAAARNRPAASRSVAHLRDGHAAETVSAEGDVHGADRTRFGVAALQHATTAVVDTHPPGGPGSGRPAHPPRGHAPSAAQVYAVVWPVVFARRTRLLELGRGHAGCARSVRELRPECFDQFQDEMEAVIEYTLRHANQPIGDLGAWIGSRLPAAAVDGHRRERGRRGALQRPRVPKWLSESLGDDPWLVDLAVQILVWVGTPTAAAEGAWPLDAWAQRRYGATDTGSRTATYRDVEAVLTAMRRRPAWYDSYVERPLGRKQTTTPKAPRGDDRGDDAFTPLALVAPHEVEEARMQALAHDAIERIKALLARGESPATAVSTVLGEVFGSDNTSTSIARPPRCADDYGVRIVTLVEDPDELARITTAVLAIISPDTSA